MFGFYKSDFINDVDKYSPLRGGIELLAAYYLVKYFEYDRIVEFGYCSGINFGVLVEAMPEYGKITVVDQEDVSEKFCEHTNGMGKNMELLRAESYDFSENLKYNFIHLDDHYSYDSAIRAMQKSVKLLDRHGVLMIEQGAELGEFVDRAIHDYLLKTDLVPFMMSDGVSWWHYPEHDCSDFLDTVLDDVFKPFCSLKNVQYKGSTVKVLETYSAIHEHFDVFKLICEKYKI